MSEKDEIIKEFTGFKGLGKAKAVLLYEGGFDSADKLKEATAKDLTKIKGISEALAISIKEQMDKKTERIEEKKSTASMTKKRGDVSVPVEKIPEVTDDKTEEKVEIVEDEYQVKLKPKLDDELKKMMSLRRRIDKRRPRFLREEWFRYKRIPRNWRRPDGLTSKMRRNLKYRPSKVRVGFRGPQAVRGLHSSGFKEVMVYNVDDIGNIDPQMQAARIGATVGMKKRITIEQKADELGIRVLNRNQGMKK
ncbi:ribosomal protein L32E [Thermoplasmatales archaeon SCGC AB-539-C06]|nr:ribosomal protein L32E [Thermoplasmatales archaeon SCGC AB-539-C06]